MRPTCRQWLARDNDIRLGEVLLSSFPSIPPCSGYLANLSTTGLWTLGMTCVDSWKAGNRKPTSLSTYPVDFRNTELIENL